MIALLIVLHVLAATVWTGGHLVLSLSVLPRALRENDAGIVARFEHGYERLGLPALLIQVVTGFALLFEHQPDTSVWFAFEDPQSPWIAVKIGLLAVTVMLALHARLRVLPNLNEAKLKALAWHIVPVTILSVLFVIAGIAIRTHGFAAESMGG